MPQRAMLHETDPKQDLLDALGDLGEIEIFNNQVLCAIYVRPEKTASGIILTANHRDEDKSQGKVGVVVKMGQRAFDDPTHKWFDDEAREGDDPISTGDWVFFRASDGWAITINGRMCRILDDINIRGRVQHPDQVW